MELVYCSLSNDWKKNLAIEDLAIKGLSYILIGDFAAHIGTVSVWLEGMEFQVKIRMKVSVEALLWISTNIKYPVIFWCTFLQHSLYLNRRMT